jgi:hypothetical protein
MPSLLRLTQLCVALLLLGIRTREKLCIQSSATTLSMPRNAAMMSPLPFVTSRSTPTHFNRSLPKFCVTCKSTNDVRLSFRLRSSYLL